ncbi:hypothetical protein AB6A23_10425 [Paenibacillus tarimensis]
MNKRKYFVSVQSRSVLTEQGQAAYELEIEATEEEVEKLQYLFQMLEEAEQSSSFRAITPGIPYHCDAENDNYDNALKACYDLVQKLGTEETVAHLSGIIDQLNNIGHYESER